MSFLPGPVTVEVPATSANLGPGFDCLGLALELTDTLVGEVTDAGLEIEVTGEGADQVPLDERHLVVASMRAAFTVLGDQPEGLRLTCTNRIPHSRGLGSSSAAIVGGIVLARALVHEGQQRLDDAAALALANRIEGHPDNVAPALIGGFVVAGQAEEPQGRVVWAQSAPVDPTVSAVVLVPPHGVRTEVARGLLPATVPHAEAAANSGRAALLVVALGGHPDLLLRATEDFLHQRQRQPAMPDSLTLVDRLRADGVPAVVSGAGPTVLAFVAGTADDPGLEAQVGRVRDAAPRGWRVLMQGIGGPGARVLL